VRPVRSPRLVFALLAAMSLGVASCRQAETGPIAVLHVRGFGEIRFVLLDKLAPRHVANFVALASSHFYDGTTFHRVIPKFMIQGGDPNSKDADPSNDGFGGPGYFLEPEFSATHHDPGIVSMARQAAPATAGSQFFIMTTGSESWRPQLDGQYTVFGRVVAGQDVVDAISKTPRDRRDRPLSNVVVESVTILPAPSSASK
jgi:peptidyl-prolyl cis-trans isomerase B (cyclophilin B)